MNSNGIPEMIKEAGESKYVTPKWPLPVLWGSLGAFLGAWGAILWRMLQ